MLTNRERQQIRDLVRNLPLTVRFEVGTRLPEVAVRELVFFENERTKTMRVGIRRDARTYWLFSSEIPPSVGQDGGGSIDLLSHARRHVTATYDPVESLVTNQDPITPFKFTWTGEHTWLPAAVGRVPVTIKAADGQSGDLFVITDNSNSNLVEVVSDGRAGFGDAPQTAQVNIKPLGFDPMGLQPWGWWSAMDITGASNGDNIATLTDQSGNSRTLTATADPGEAPQYGTSGVLPPHVDCERTEDEAFELAGTETLDDFTIISLVQTRDQGQEHVMLSSGTGGSGTSDADHITNFRRNASETDGFVAAGIAGVSSTNIGDGQDRSEGTAGVQLVSVVTTKASATSRSFTILRFNGLDRLTGGTETLSSVTGGAGTFDVKTIIGKNCFWRETIIFDRALTLDEVIAVENYLSNKWSFNTYTTANSLVDGTDESATASLNDMLAGFDTGDTRRVHLDSEGRFGLDVDPTIRLQVRDTIEQARLEYDATNYAAFTVSSSGNLTVAPTGDLILAPVGDNVIIRGDSGAQLELEYDGSNQTTFTVESDGDLVITPSGGDVGINITPSAALHVLGSGGTVVSLENSGSTDLFSLAENGTATFMPQGNDVIIDSGNHANTGAVNTVTGFLNLNNDSASSGAKTGIRWNNTDVGLNNNDFWLVNQNASGEIQLNLFTKTGANSLVQVWSIPSSTSGATAALELLVPMQIINTGTQLTLTNGSDDVFFTANSSGELTISSDGDLVTILGISTDPVLKLDAGGGDEVDFYVDALGDLLIQPSGAFLLYGLATTAGTRTLAFQNSTGSGTIAWDGTNWNFTPALVAADVPNHVDLNGFVANEHVDHTSVILTAGAGLSGGGDITTSRTIDVDINGATDLGASVATGDEVLVADVSDSNNIKKTTVGDIVDLARIDSGTSFPGSPSDGDHFYRTDLDELFKYDSGRSKWLGSTLLVFHYGTNAVLAVNQYLSGAGGAVFSASAGYWMPFDVTVVGISWDAVSVLATVDLAIAEDGTNQVVVDTAGDDQGDNMGLNTDISADSSMTVKIATGSGFNVGSVLVFARQLAS